MANKHIITGTESLVGGLPGYSAAVIAGRTVYVAGQTAGRDADGNVVGRDDILTQATAVYENLRTALERAGASFEDVTKITVFATRPEYRQTLGEVRARFMPQPPPASTFVVITALADPDFLCEVEAIAVINGGG